MGLQTKNSSSSPLAYNRAYLCEPLCLCGEAFHLGTGIPKFLLRKQESTVSHCKVLESGEASGATLIFLKGQGKYFIAGRDGQGTGPRVKFGTLNVDAL